jgi:hypothetical protein
MNVNMFEQEPAKNAHIARWLSLTTFPAEKVPKKGEFRVTLEKFLNGIVRAQGLRFPEFSGLVL